MTWRYPHGLLVQFAKTPVRGGVKTRLQPVLGEAGCLALHKILVRQTCNSLQQSRLAPVEIWASAPDAEGFFPPMVANDNLHIQQGKDLGERMCHAFTHCLARSRWVVLVGSDCPALDQAYLAQAFAALTAGFDAVLGPAQDGGYVLIGLKRVSSVLFHNIPWGTAGVLAKTCDALHQLGWRYRKLHPLPDIDRPEDLPFLSPLWPVYPFLFP